MQRTVDDGASPVRREARRVGYGIAVAINLLLLVVVQNVADWDVLGFLTAGFEQVVPWITLALLASIVANVGYQFRDDQAFRSRGEIATNLIGLIAIYRLYDVFPFDFSAYEFDWAVIVRILLVLAMVGAGIGIVTETARLVRAVAIDQPASSSSSRS